MRKTTFLIGVALFTTGFAGMVGWSWRERSPDTGAEGAEPLRRVAVVSAPSPGHADLAAPVQPTAPTAPAQRPAPVIDAASQRRSHEVEQLVATPQDEAVPALQGLLNDSPDEETRLLAVKALSELAKKADSQDVSTGDAIRSSVLQAAYDNDPGVAQAAQDEYARLNGFDR